MGLHYGPISPDTLDGDFDQVPVFENTDVLDTIGADDPNHSQTDETKPNDGIYVSAKPNPTSKINFHKRQDFYNVNNDVASAPRWYLFDVVILLPPRVSSEGGRSLLVVCCFTSQLSVRVVSHGTKGTGPMVRHETSVFEIP